MRILVAGIGNIFFGDDAFGVEVAQQLLRRPWPEDVRIEDFGIRSYDLAYAIMDGWDTVIMIDATPRGHPPGTVSLIEPDLSTLGDNPSDIVNGHSLNPVSVLQMVQSLGGTLPCLYLIGCEPAVLETEDLGLSAAVQATVPQAIEMTVSLIHSLLDGTATEADAISAGISGRSG